MPTKPSADTALELDSSNPLSAETRVLFYFNEGTGTTVHDLSGHGNHLTLTGDASWTDESSDEGISSETLTGAQMGSFPADDSWHTEDAFTVVYRFVSHGTDRLYGAESDNKGLGVYNGNHLYVRLDTDDDSIGDTWSDNAIEPGYADEVITTIVHTFDGTHVRGYLNGALSFTEAVAGKVAYHPTNPFCFHANNGAGASPITDKMFLWSGAAFTDDDVVWITANPYGLTVPSDGGGGEIVAPHSQAVNFAIYAGA